MEKKTNDAANLIKLTPEELKNINGGGYVEFTINGTVYRVKVAM